MAAAPLELLTLSPDLLVLVRPQAPATTENTSDIARRQTSVQDTVATPERHHAAFAVSRIDAPLAVSVSGVSAAKTDFLPPVKNR